MNRFGTKQEGSLVTRVRLNELAAQRGDPIDFLETQAAAWSKCCYTRTNTGYLVQYRPPTVLVPARAQQFDDCKSRADAGNRNTIEKLLVSQVQPATPATVLKSRVRGG